MDILRLGDWVVMEEPINEYGEPVQELTGKTATVIELTKRAVGPLGYGQVSGLYESQNFVFVRLESGERIEVPGFWLKLMDQTELQLRQTWWQEHCKRFGQTPLPRYVGELPPFEFWPDDRIQSLDPNYRQGPVRVLDADGIGVVQHICFHGQEVIPMGFPYYLPGLPPHFQIARSMKAGGVTICEANQLKLIDRGNVWKFYHRQAMTFNTLGDEAQLNDQLGLTVVVYNNEHAEGLWSVSDATAAIRDGFLDSVRQGIAYGDAYYGLRYKNRPLAARLRQAFPNDYNPFGMQRPTSHP